MKIWSTVYRTPRSPCQSPFVTLRRVTQDFSIDSFLVVYFSLSISIWLARSFFLGLKKNPSCDPRSFFLSHTTNAARSPTIDNNFILTTLNFLAIERQQSLKIRKASYLSPTIMSLPNSPQGSAAAGRLSWQDQLTGKQNH